MKKETIRNCEVLSQVLIIASVAWAGLITASSLWAVTTPPPPGTFYLDYETEIKVLATVMNIAIPAAILGLINCCLFESLAKKWKPGFLILALVSVLVMTVLTVAVWNHMDRLHGDDVNLWDHHIWW